MQRNQYGFSHFIAVAVIAVVIGVGAFAAYRISQLNDDSVATNESGLTAAQAAKVEETPQLKEANTALTDVESDLASDLDMSVLDEDIDALY